jgi:hypothetical protein
MFNKASSYVLIVLLILVPRNSLTTQYCLSIVFFSILASDIAIISFSVGLVYDFQLSIQQEGRRGRDRIGFTTTYAISAYHH